MTAKNFYVNLVTGVASYTENLVFLLPLSLWLYNHSLNLYNLWSLYKFMHHNVARHAYY